MIELSLCIIGLGVCIAIFFIRREVKKQKIPFSSRLEDTRKKN